MRHIASSIPSPGQGVWMLGPVPLRAYALIILAGIGVAIWLGNKRWIARGGLPNQVMDIAMWAVPFGVIGGRLYHVLTDWSSYFSANGKGFIASLQIWNGGLGIWGAIALGGVGVYIGSRRQRIAFQPLADALAPGIVFAQAIGRWGNWFNQELFGKPTKLPWGLEISAIHRPVGYEEFETFHPTFLYESLACIAIGFIVIWADKRFNMGHGRVFALYVALYCSARGAIETLRIDEAHHVLGIRLNVFTALIVGGLALIFLILSGERHPGREEVIDGQILSKRAKREREERIETEHKVEVAQEAAIELSQEPTQKIETLSRRQRRQGQTAAQPAVQQVARVAKPQVSDLTTQLVAILPDDYNNVFESSVKPQDQVSQERTEVLNPVAQEISQTTDERSKERGRRRKR